MSRDRTARPDARELFLAAALVLLFLLHSLFYFIALGYDAVDDAYISFRYALNAVLGYGLIFNPGERVEGFTNFLWTALLVPVAGAGLDLGRVSIVLGVLFALGTLWLTFGLAHELESTSRKGRGISDAVGWLAAFLLTADGSFAIWSVSGMETALFAFLLTAGAVFYLREQKTTVETAPLLPRSAVLFALAALTRPEAGAVFALTTFHQAAWRAAAERRLWRRIDLRRIFTFGALFVPYWLLRWRYYHSFFPNSFYAKVAPGGPIAQLERGAHYVAQFVGVHLGVWLLLPALLALAAAVVRTRRGSRGEAEGPFHSLFGLSYCALITLAYVAYIVYVGGDWSVGRFFVPVLPLAYVTVAAGLVEAYRLLTAGRNLRWAAPVAVAAAAVLMAALAWSSSWMGEYGIFVRGFDAARATEAREAMGRWLKANVPRGTLIAVDAAGQVPYFSELPAIDMFGINDWHIGRLNVATLGQGTPGHEKFDLGYLIARAPRYVIIYGTLFDNVSEYRRAAAAWTSDPSLGQFLTLYERR